MGLVILWSVFCFLCGIVFFGAFDGFPLTQLAEITKARHGESRANLVAEYERGRAEAISALVENDENAAIVEAITAGILSLSYSGRWKWSDAALSRASIEAVGLTPRDALRSYKAQRAAAARICEQLDEIARAKKEAAEEAAA